MQIGQRLVVIELAHLRHDRAEDVGDLPHGGQEPAQRGPVHAGGAASRRSVLQQQAFGGGDGLFRRQEGEGQEVAALEMPFLGLEAAAALIVDQGGDRIGEKAGRVVLRGRAQRLEVETPAGAQAAQGVVELSAGGHQPRIRGAGQIGAAKGQGLLEAAILVQQQARTDQRHPGQMIEEPVGLGAIFPQIKHRRPSGLPRDHPDPSRLGGEGVGEAGDGEGDDGGAGEAAPRQSGPGWKAGDGRPKQGHGQGEGGGRRRQGVSERAHDQASQ